MENDILKKSEDMEKRSKPASMRPSDIIRGLAKPHDSREYKEALIGLQRQFAPLLAIVLPLIVIAVLAIVTSVTIVKKKEINMPVAVVEEEMVDLEPLPEDPPPVQTVDPIVDPVEDIVTDVDIKQPVAEASAPVGEAPAALSAPSPATLSNVKAAIKFGLPGGGNGFGARLSSGTQVPPGTLIGTMFDLKTRPDGKPAPGYNQNKYWGIVKKLINNKFSPGGNYRKLDRRVALTHILIPPQKAENGPKAFGLDDVMKPSGWIANYHSVLRPAYSGRYRFIGQFDDVMIVQLDGKTVFETNWGNDGTRPAAVTGWKPVNVKDARKWKGPQKNGYLVFSDWFYLDADREKSLNILIGERPGGIISGILLIEKEGEKYEKTPEGRPIWPIFSTTRLSIPERERISKYFWPVSDKAPPMNWRPAESTAQKDDVVVMVDGM